MTTSIPDRGAEPVAASPGVPPPPELPGEVPTLELEPDPEALFEEFVAKGWCDGLPFIPPTEERVARMLRGTDRDPDEPIGRVPPNDGLATVRAVAINAVMAGCRPAYLSVVLTALEAALVPAANLRAGLTTTFPSWPFVVVNGPVRRELDINCSWGLLSNLGSRPNATIGRALTLVFTNIGGVQPGVTEMKPQGTTMRYTPVFGEYEEESPWEPLHVERGVPPEVSTVTVFADFGMPVFIYSQTYGHSTFELWRYAQGMATNTLPHPMMGALGCDPLLLINPLCARQFAADGWTKDDVKRFLYENARNPRSALISSPHNAQVPDEVREHARSVFVAGQPKWAQELMESPYVTHPWVPIVKRPEDFTIVVAGYPAPAGGRALFFPGHSMRERSVTRPIADRAGRPVGSVLELVRGA